MSFTGYSSSGLEYNINSDRGNNFIQNASAGSKITGSDGSQWTKNSDGTTTITRGDDTWTVGSALGNLQNALDMITKASDKTSARNLEYAQQQQEWSANQANIANNFNAAEAAKNRDWQEYMSNTAHQREVADLKAAGLNPVLSAMNGNGAAVTSGASANANLPSGDSAKSDSSTTAIVQMLSSMLAAQTQLTNTAMSARSNEAIADKYTSMSELTALIAANASKYASDNSYAAAYNSSLNSLLGSMFGSATAFEGTKYSANTGYAGALLNSNTQRWIANLQSMTQKDIAQLESSLRSAGINASLVGSLIGLLGSIIPK